jgi:DNA-binding NarL/FixJ family response regulator
LRLKANMKRIAVVTPSALLASGLLAALAEEPAWHLTVQEDCTQADAAVLHVRDAAESLALWASLPTGLPAVILGDDLRELAQRSAGQTRALALLSPDASAAQLRAALAAVLQGLCAFEAPSNADAAWRAPNAFSTLDFEPLTARELEVFELIGKGLSNPDIAGVLGISAHTAKFHVGQILAKVGAATRAEAVSCGLKMGLIGL